MRNIPSYISSQPYWLLSERKANEYMRVLMAREKGTNTPENFKNYNKKVNACAFATITKSRKLAIDRRVTDGGGFTMFLGEDDEEGIAIIPLVGAMLKRGNMTGDVSGVRDTRDVSAEINEALQSKWVKAIVLEVDSGGGSVDGTEELANIVASANKPIVVWGDGLIASAAYWVSSQADYIMMSSANTSEVGSIGVYSIYANYSGLLEKEGVKMQILRSTGSGDKIALNPIEEPSQQAIDAEVAQMDVVLDTFISAVRSTRAEKLRTAQNQDIDIFTGKVFNASQGIELGLVDGIGALDDAIFLAYEMSNNNQGAGGSRANNQNRRNMSLMKKIGSIFSAAEKGDEAQAESQANALAEEMKAQEIALAQAQAKIAELEAQKSLLSAENNEQKAGIEANNARLQALEQKIQVIGNEPESEVVQGKAADTNVPNVEGKKRVSKYAVEANKTMGVKGSDTQVIKRRRGRNNA